MVQLQLHINVCRISQLKAGVSYIETNGSEREEFLLQEKRVRTLRDGEFIKCENRETVRENSLMKTEE